jgi:hypothetical protein
LHSLRHQAGLCRRSLNWAHDRCYLVQTINLRITINFPVVTSCGWVWIWICITRKHSVAETGRNIETHEDEHTYIHSRAQPEHDNAATREVGRNCDRASAALSGQRKCPFGPQTFLYRTVIIKKRAFWVHKEFKTSYNFGFRTWSASNVEAIQHFGKLCSCHLQGEYGTLNINLENGNWIFCRNVW